MMAEPAARTPRVSIVVPSYKTAPFITETLDSVFAQTFSNFEVIVINDGSPDTEELERELQPFIDRIIYIKQPNRGPGAARNAGIRAARGEFLAFLDSDDTWLPEYLASQMECFEKTPSLDLICADTLFYGDSHLSGHTFLERCRWKGPVTFERMLTDGNPLTTSCVVARKRVVVDVGLFDEIIRGPEDYELWLRIAHAGANIDRQWKVLARHRVHPASLSAGDEANWMVARIQMAKKLQQSLHLSPERRSLLEKKLLTYQATFDIEQGKRYLADGDFARAKYAFEKANALLPSKKLQLVLRGLRVSPSLTRLGAKLFEAL
jgi:glycosyltransferase involved in cell wall biosynthesis